MAVVLLVGNSHAVVVNGNIAVDNMFLADSIEVVVYNIADV